MLHRAGTLMQASEDEKLLRQGLGTDSSVVMNHPPIVRATPLRVLQLRSVGRLECRPLHARILASRGVALDSWPAEFSERTV